MQIKLKFFRFNYFYMLSETQAIEEYRPFVTEEDPYGYGPDVFLNNHAAVVIPEFPVKSDTHYLFDSKTEGYPQVCFVKKYVFPGGNRRTVTQLTPYNVLEDELREEWKGAGDRTGRRFAELVLSYARPYADYMIAVPKEVHGNQKLPSCYVFVATFYLSQIPVDGLRRLGVNINGELPQISEGLFNFVKPFYREAEPAIVSRSSLVDGTALSKFAWGYDRVMRDYLGTLNLRLGVPLLEGIKADRLDIEPGLIYADRLTNMRDRLNPDVRGRTSKDPDVFKPG